MLMEEKTPEETARHPKKSDCTKERMENG